MAEGTLLLNPPLTVTGLEGFDRYNVLRRLGAGGTGVVYHVYDRERDEELALKTLQRMSSASLLLFKQEFRALAGVVHDNLVSLYELGVTNSTWFITMELVRGCNFLDYVTRLDATADAETVTGLPPSAMEPAVVAETPPSSSEPRVDVGRLRDATAQLAIGLQALHAAGKLHRDIKPSNVLVDTSGRVVLVDFGLVTEIADANVVRPISGSHLRGTIRYMAPELFASPGTGPGPATDWFSVGVMLYYALTGTHPPVSAGFAGDRPIPAPSALAMGVPPFLDELCLALLSADPSRRPTGAQILHALGEAPVRETPYEIRALAAGVPFVGRSDHLARLRAAHARSKEGRSAVIVVSGRSGIGKTTLVRRFLQELVENNGALILQGRCYDQESVPYKAVDSLIDDLAQHLAGLPLDVLRATVPPDFGLLADLFPVLTEIAVELDRAQPIDATRTRPEDPLERRHRAFIALRDVLARLAVRQPLVLFIDDIQWSDRDSETLLTEILGAGMKAPVLLIACFRPSGTSTADSLAAALTAMPAGVRSEPFTRADVLVVNELATVDACRLAADLLARERDEVAPEIVERIAQDAAGHPLFIQELARASAAPHGGEATATPTLTLEEVIGRRVERLPPSARRLLDAVAVAGRPERASIVLIAAGLAAREREAIALLRTAGFLVDLDTPERRRLDVAHDRIRRVVSERLPAEQTRALHAALAHELDRAGDTDLETLFEHYLRADVRPRAAELAAQAGDQAERALAFERAAELYLKGLELGSDGADRVDLLARAARALGNAGHAPESAQRYLQAVAALEETSTAGSRPRQLRLLAAEQHIKNGDLTSGWRVMRTVLEALGIPVPRSQPRAMLYGTWRRVLFLARYRGLRLRQTAAPSERTRERLDVLWTASTSFSMVNVFLSDAFRGMHLLDALRSGDRSMMCRALAFEAAMETHIGGSFFDRQCPRLLAKAEELSAETQDPYDRAWYHLALGNVAATRGRLSETVEFCGIADSIFRESCPGTYWERSTTLAYFREALAARGDFVELRKMQDDFLAEMADRGALYGVLETYSLRDGFLRWVADDAPEAAYGIAVRLLAQEDAGAEGWPEAGYKAQHAYLMCAFLYLELYRGRPEAAWRAVVAQWSDVRKSFLLSLRLFRAHLLSMRGRAAIALAAQQARALAPAITPEWRTSYLLAETLRIAGRLADDSFPAARPWGLLLEAGAACVSEDVARARRLLADAVEAFDRCEMAAYREVARYALASLMRPGAARARMRDLAENWLRQQGVVDVARFAAALCPGVLDSDDLARAEPRPAVSAAADVPALRSAPVQTSRSMT